MSQLSHHVPVEFNVDNSVPDLEHRVDETMATDLSCDCRRNATVVS